MVKLAPNPTPQFQDASYEYAYQIWEGKRNRLFPNWHLLNSIYDRQQYEGYRAWEKSNPAPVPKLCRWCGTVYPPEENRWCCNPQCSSYLL